MFKDWRNIKVSTYLLLILTLLVLSSILFEYKELISHGIEISYDGMSIEI